MPRLIDLLAFLVHVFRDVFCVAVSLILQNMCFVTSAAPR